MLRTVRTTVTLPANLLEAMDRAVREGNARSRNELITIALRRELAAQERAAIDAAFARPMILCITPRLVRWQQHLLQRIGGDTLS